MWNRYTYCDYEECFYKHNWVKCKEIALHILSKLNDEKSLELKNKLEQDDINNYQLYFDIKVWIMVNSPC